MPNCVAARYVMSENVVERMAVKIDYVTSPQEGSIDPIPVGMEEFRRELEDAYVSLIRGHPGVRGGGWYQFAIQVTSSITLRDLANLILGGIAYDLLKSGVSSFVLRPLLHSYAKLASRNSKIEFGVDEVSFFFQDTDVIIKKTGTQFIHLDLENILTALVKNYEHLLYRGELPYVIHIPVFEDKKSHFSRFRSMLDVDETIQNIVSDNYFQYWGVRYNRAGKVCVFDVQRQIILDEQYMTQSEYWIAWNKAWEKDSAYAQKNDLNVNKNTPSKR